jgi:hypothetical protein
MGPCRDEQGQSTIEFALSVFLTVGFFLFVVQLSFLFAYGNLVHYATFMAARAQLAAGLNGDDQDRRAKETIILLLKKSVGQPGVEKYGFIAQGQGGGVDVPGYTPKGGSVYNPKKNDFSWMYGVRYKFRGKVTSIPIGSSDAGVNYVTLTSESWLGVEPSYSECRSWMSGPQASGGMIDNGC